MSLRQKIILILFVLIGTIIQIIPTFRSGLEYSYGIGFWGPSGHDSVWHLSLINHIDNPLSINMPIFSGSKLTNYHPFYDILIAKLSQLTHLSSSLILFQIFPVFSSIVFLYLSFHFGKIVTKSYKGGLIFLSLNSIANSFGWIISYFKFGNFSGESIFWAMQSPSNQINPPYQLSLIFILILLIIIVSKPTYDKLTSTDYLAIFVVLLLLPITKAYSAVVGFSIIGLYCFNSALMIRRYLPLIFFGITLAFSTGIFYYYNPNTSSIMVFMPFWFINSMIESPDRIFIPFLANMRYAASLTGNIPKLIFASTISFFIFIIGNFSWRLYGVLETIRRPNQFKYVILGIIIVLTAIPTLFIQKGTSWNTIQFLYYALFLSNILFTFYLTKSSNFFILIVFLGYFVGFFGSINNYLGKIPPASLPKDEIVALNFLKNQPKGIVLTAPYDPYLKSHFSTTPIPLYAYETTAYASAYSYQTTYLEDEMNLNNSGYNYQSRHDQSTAFFNQKNTFQDRGFLINNQINYIYLAGIQQQTYKLDSAGLSLSIIFQNPGATIYKVQR